jgi:hypothetical protein
LVEAATKAEQAWELIWSVVGGGVLVVLALCIMLMIADVVRDKLHDRRMRRHFDDTRGRR